jgi:fumarate hydratase class II
MEVPTMPSTREEHDSLGPVQVPADRLWGAQTQRSLDNFRIGAEKMPLPLIHAFAWQKLAAVRANRVLGLIPLPLAEAIAAAAEEVAEGKLDDHFPLVVWQTGSGTQTNMNLNEVIANRANQLLGAPLGGKAPVHPNDHVNLSQSSNDSFPTAMHIATVLGLERQLLPALEGLRAALRAKALAFAPIVKIGRTHLQDAVPLRLGAEFATWAAQLDSGIERVRRLMPGLLRLAQGGTAVGSGLNAPPGFDGAFCRALGEMTGLAFTPAADKGEMIAAHDDLVETAGVLNALAVALTKIAGDIRLLGSGPRCGLGELALPENEPGSSIMPGKVNPTQAEALIMVCAKVMGNSLTVTLGGAGGQLQLNACKPMIIDALLQSIRLLSDGCDSFTRHCVLGITAETNHIAELVERSLMLVTALAPHIGYDKAAKIARAAHLQGLTLREAAIASGWVTEAQFDGWVRPEGMV